MKGLNQALLSVSAVALLALTACGKKEEVAEVPVEKVPTAAMSSKPAAPAMGGVAGLKSVVTTTKAAVASGDFAKASASIGKFEAAWKPVEDGIKAKSPKIYSLVEDSIPKLTAAIKNKDKAGAMAVLVPLETAMSTLK